MKIGTVAEMRQIDKRAAEEYGLPGLLLMENAGHRAAEAMADLLGGAEGKTVCVLAGSGNNGGDALCAARHLAGMGARVRIFLTGERDHFSEDTAVMYGAVEKMELEIHTIDNDRDWNRMHVALRFADGLLDGILGTGFHGELRKKTLRIIEEVNEAGRPVLSIDVPSGMEADTGHVSTVAVDAAETLALALPKPCHFFSPGTEHTGRLLVDDIGIPRTLLEDPGIHQYLLDDTVAAELLPPRARDAHKGSCGRILVIAGSRGMTGAAVLASKAALRAGAGIVTLAVPESLHDILETKLTEVMTVPIPEETVGHLGGEEALQTLLRLAGGYDTILIGPGLGRAQETGELVRLFLAEVDQPVVVDADGLYAFTNCEDQLKACHQIPVLTPHLGELARLAGCSVSDLREDLTKNVRELAAKLQCVLVAKSECTLVAYPDGDVYFTAKGNPGMATAGCGDVLAGTIAGLMEQTQDGLAPILGVWMHGEAGDLAYADQGEGLVATDILAQLPQARQNLRNFQENNVSIQKAKIR